MAVLSDSSPKAAKGRMKCGSSSQKRRSSKARSSISGGSWDQGSFPFSLRQASFNTATRRPNAAKSRQNQKMRASSPALRPGSARVVLALNQSSEQVRPFDAFVDVPSPFAKQKIDAKTKDSSDSHHRGLTVELTYAPTPVPAPNLTPSSLSPRHNLVNEAHFISDHNMYSHRTPQRIEGYLDTRTRAANLQHTRPEWMTWDFVDLFLSNLPPGIRTVDLWNNFKKEGEVDTIDIFVTRDGQKDNKARLRFRQVLSDHLSCDH